MQKTIRVLVLSFALIIALSFAGVQPQLATAQEDMDEEPHFTYTVTVTNPRLIRNVMGEITADVQGVPAVPVHAFAWDGEGVFPIKGSATLEVDPVANTGELTAEWTDEYGSWTLTQTVFTAPPHPSGLKIAGSGDNAVLVEDDPIPVNVYLHGATGAAEPVLPTVFNLIATWGPAEVTLDGEPFENPYDGPTPMWVTHTMTTPGVRDPDGAVRMANGDIYSPELRDQDPANDYDDLEFHLVFHDLPGPDSTESFPPATSFFYHLSFEDVVVEIHHTGGSEMEMME